MKILDIKLQNSQIRITTDNPERPVFVYSQEKFADHNELVIEIEKSIASEQKRQDTRNARLDRVLGEFRA